MRRFPAIVARVLLGVLLLLVGFALFAYWSFYSQFRGSDVPPQEVFEALIASPIPETVTNLQGARSNSMQGYLAYLRFQAPSLASAGLDGAKYQPVDCTEIALRLEPPDWILWAFSPEWALPSSPERSCLEATGLRNRWAMRARNHIMYDRGWVHFVSSAD